MSRTDEELAQALQEAEANHTSAGGSGADTVEAAGAVSAPLTPAEPPRRSLGLLISLLAIIGVVLTLVMTSFDNGAIYSMGVDDYVAKKDQLGARNLRIDGKLVSGTLVKRVTPCEYRFKLEKNGSQLDVHYSQCVVPDTFRDVKGVDVLVTAEGKIAGDGYLAASQIFAKCPSKYEMKQVAEAKGMDTTTGMDPLLVPAKVIDN